MLKLSASCRAESEPPKSAVYIFSDRSGSPSIRKIFDNVIIFVEIRRQFDKISSLKYTATIGGNLGMVPRNSQSFPREVHLCRSEATNRAPTDITAVGVVQGVSPIEMISFAPMGTREGEDVSTAMGAIDPQGMTSAFMVITKVGVVRGARTDDPKGGRWTHGREDSREGGAIRSRRGQMGDLRVPLPGDSEGERGLPPSRRDGLPPTWQFAPSHGGPLGSPPLPAGLPAHHHGSFPGPERRRGGADRAPERQPWLLQSRP